MSSHWQHWIKGIVGQEDIAVFIQNAYSEIYVGREWPRDSWLSSLMAARTGQRLNDLFGTFRWVPFNTTLEVAKSASGVCKPDLGYIAAVLAQGPRAVVTCGSQALRAVGPLWTGPLLALPHPAYRCLTDALYQDAHDWLAKDLELIGRKMNRTNGRWPIQFKLSQRRGHSELENL